MYNILFIGAHHDDIEIGTGGSLSKFIDQGHNVSALILTDDIVEGSVDTRRNESILSLGALGLDRNKIHFAGFGDGNLSENKDSVTKVRNLLKEHGLAPDIIVCHTDSDSHNDHRACSGIITSSFRESVILRYPIVNSLITSSFTPQFFVDTSNYLQTKFDALKNHCSQEANSRIMYSEIKKLDSANGERIGSTYAEGFEIVVQAGGEKKEELLFQLNESPFHKLWWSLVKNDEIYYIHSLPRIGSNPNIANWIPNNDRLGAALLKESLVRDYNYKGFKETPCSHYAIESVMENWNILLGGGPVNNTVTRNYFNHFPGIRYRVDYDMPGFANVRIEDKINHTQIVPKYSKTREGMKMLHHDFGILTIMKNIACQSKDKVLIGCMGTHGFGAFGCYRILTEHKFIQRLLRLFSLPLSDKDTIGYQLLFIIKPQIDELEILDESLHTISHSAI